MTLLDLYEQATINLKETLASLQEIDPLLVEELEIICNIIERAPKGYLENLSQGPLPEVSREKILSLVEEFLRACDPKYAEKFIDDINLNNIVFGTYKEGSFFGKTDDESAPKVHIDETHTLDDAISIVHEFFHKLNFNDYVYRQSFSDSVSITAELLFIEFLKEKDYSEYDISLLSNRRNYFFEMNTSYLRKLLPLYVEVAESGEITDETYINVAHNYYGKNDFIDFLYKQVVNCNDRLDMALMYRHSLGYIAASVFHQQGQGKEELVEANDTLKEGKISDFNLLLGNGIFATSAPACVIKELKYFKMKTE